MNFLSFLIALLCWIREPTMTRTLSGSSSLIFSSQHVIRKVIERVPKLVSFLNSFISAGNIFHFVNEMS
jgi:hypothetical protein